jgi:replicative DNA helicase
MSWAGTPFAPAVDREVVQAVAVAAAAAGDAACLARLPALHATFDEPYRTLAGVVLELRTRYGYLDPNVLGAALEGRRLTRLAANGQQEELLPAQAVNLVFGTAVQPGQAAAYLDVLQADLELKRRDELRSRIRDIAAAHADQPERLYQEVGEAIRGARASGPALAGQHPAELLEIIPYARDLERQQVGTEFQGLDSGFQHVNYLCNGLDTGLFVVAAPPGEGKTTLVWQTCCQAALLNQAPVVFVSFEQSKRELRAKAVARLARLQYRHVLRGRLRANDPQEWPRVLEALQQYAQIGRNLTVVEGDDTTTVEAMRGLVAEKVARAGADRCLLGVDYLQIVPLAAEDAGRVTSPKDRVDLHVSALRRLARDLNASILCISSENRAGYAHKGLDVFKESGGIEYSADVAAVLTRDRAATAAAGAEYRVQDLNIVKNRNGECGVVKFKFYAKRAEFVETGRADLPSDLAD